MGKQWKHCQTFFGGGSSKIAVDGDCSHEIKRSLFLGRKVMVNLDNILKSRDITLPTKVFQKSYELEDYLFWILNIMRNAVLEKAQAGIKIAGRNINNLRYADTTLIAESEEELKSLLMKVKEESERASLKLNI